MQGDAIKHIHSDGEIVSDEEPARLVSVEDAARMLAKITTRHVYNLFDDGELETVKVGRRRCVVVASIDAYVERLREVNNETVDAA